jgi:hypothetical protein
VLVVSDCYSKWWCAPNQCRNVYQMLWQTDLALLPLCAHAAERAAHEAAGSSGGRRPLHRLQAVRREGAWKAEWRARGRVELLLQSKSVLAIKFEHSLVR